MILVILPLSIVGRSFSSPKIDLRKLETVQIINLDFIFDLIALKIKSAASKFGNPEIFGPKIELKLS